MATLLFPTLPRINKQIPHSLTKHISATQYHGRRPAHPIRMSMTRLRMKRRMMGHRCLKTEADLILRRKGCLLRLPLFDLKSTKCLSRDFPCHCHPATARNSGSSMYKEINCVLINTQQRHNVSLLGGLARNPSNRSFHSSNSAASPSV